MKKDDDEGTIMTSNNALSQFADLSPEQRQLLFEKIRQKKLNSARRPVQASTHRDEATGLALSPHQAHLLAHAPAATANRLVDIRFQGQLAFADLQKAVDTLCTAFVALSARFDAAQHQFVPGAAPACELVQLAQQSDDEAKAHLAEVRSRLQRRGHDDTSLSITLLQGPDGDAHLLLACHPLLLDSYSLLRLGNQLLAMLFANVATVELPDQCNQTDFARWSQQMLEKKFLSNEWTRLAPKSLQGEPQQAPAPQHDTHLETLSADFINAHVPVGSSAKQWLCEALHGCLHSWLSHQDVTYWFLDPNLKDSVFENLLGYFPYYAPIQGSKTQGQTFNVSNQLANLHTRFAAVSEHLAQHLCQHGTTVPLVHYHWFDINAEQHDDFALGNVEHLSSGLMLAPFEVHIIEQVDRISLSIHYDPQRMGLDQIQFLVRDLKALLKQDHHNDPNSRPNLGDQLRAIWKDLLQKNEIPAGASFFELGGHSLQVTEMKFRIKQQLKLEIPISVLYELPTIEKLASFILATHGNSLGWMPEQSSPDDEEEEGTL